MGWSIAADTVLVIHFAFVVFIVSGALLIRWRRGVLWLHIAALGYGIAIQAIGFTCPLTPLEKSLRRAAGEAAYDGGFIGHYIVPLLYPGQLTTTAKLGLVFAVAAVNAAAYLWVFSAGQLSQVSIARFGGPRCAWGRGLSGRRREGLGSPRGWSS